MWRDLWAQLWQWLEHHLPDMTAVFDDDADDQCPCCDDPQETP